MTSTRHFLRIAPILAMLAMAPQTAMAAYEARGTVIVDGERLKGVISVDAASISIDRERLIRKDKGMTFALTDIETIRYEAGLFGGAIYITTKNGKNITLEDLGGKQVKAIKELLKDKI